jgi:hypothetical protein
MFGWLKLMTLVLMLTASGGNGSESTEAVVDEQSDTGSDTANTGDDGSDDTDDADPDEDGDSGNGRVQGTTFERGFNNLLERFGNNARRVAEHLYRQDYKHRENLRLARGEVEQLKTKLPRDGSRTVDRNTYRELESYRKLGKPAELQSKLSSGEQAAKALKGREKDDQLRDVAEVTKWNYKALKGAASDLDYVVKEVEDGKGGKVKQAFVVTRNGEQATEVAAPEWFQSNRDFLMPALTAGTNGGGGTTTYGQQFIAQPVSQQRSNGSQQVPSAASAILSRYEEPKTK